MPSDPHLAIGEQFATAVYENPYGGIVIRQEARWNDDEWVFVVIRPENLQRLIDALSGFLP
jgi:hypothetical protein